MVKKVYKPIRVFKVQDKRMFGYTIPILTKEQYNRIYRQSMNIIGYTRFKKEDDFHDVLEVLSGKRKLRFAVDEIQGLNTSEKYYIPVSETEAIAVDSLFTVKNLLRYTVSAAVCLAIGFIVYFLILHMPSRVIKNELEGLPLEETEYVSAGIFNDETETESGVQTGSIVKDLDLLDKEDNTSTESSSGEDNNKAAPTQELQDTSTSVTGNVTTSEQIDNSISNTGGYENDWINPEWYPTAPTDQELAENAEDYSAILMPPKVSDATISEKNKKLTIINTNSTAAIKITFADKQFGTIELASGKSTSIEAFSVLNKGVNAIAYTCEFFDSEGSLVATIERTFDVTVKK